MSSANNLGLTNPIQIHKRKIVEVHNLNLPRSPICHIHHSQRGVLRDKSELVSRRSPPHTLHPSSSGVLAQHLMPEREPLSVGGVLRLLIQTLDESREDTDLPVTSSGGNQHISRVPVNRGDSGLVLFDVLGDPPVVLLLVVADGDTFSAAGDSEFVLWWEREKRKE